MGSRDQNDGFGGDALMVYLQNERQSTESGIAIRAGTD
jgi:hypothetical protein